MPRQIIDTESSRGAYVRRVVRIIVVVALGAALLAYAIVAHGWKI